MKTKSVIFVVMVVIVIMTLCGYIFANSFADKKVMGYRVVCALEDKGYFEVRVISCHGSAIFGKRGARHSAKMYKVVATVMVARHKFEERNLTVYCPLQTSQRVIIVNSEGKEI